MHTASREALAQVSSHIDTALQGNENAVAIAAQTGAELFDVVDVLEGDRRLRIAVADSSRTAQQRSGLISAVFAGKVSQTTLEVLITAASLEWSTPREFRAGLVELGRHALLRSAEVQGQIGQVEEELFRLSRLLGKEAQLTLLLDDRSADPQRKSALFASVLYGKVTAVTEALALQVTRRTEHNVIDDINALSKKAAALQGRDVAFVVSATELSGAQNDSLANKLEQIYGRAMNIHSEVDPSLLGGMIIRVGDEVIDGSTSGKIERLRANFV
ncbi:F0F1 ATP synthase subunit delta [Corynebacterium sp. sy017]|uniref:F0F1 ATP synthase subunit delta n=1 Tax=unclassified Corynebacterium TaxID=2624378 RepID=UPI001184E280|nr:MULTISPECIES: F0F1 ATP synthase subunit delta [unclassified Corynebacterium]MBP3089014.1 F0F1 ATP synthase subunit delta [Corynebacterium sp. sy017]TSD91336.1 F0F1 ATP synthase subunit delta [Corynebacterium sp. SY003]